MNKCIVCQEDPGCFCDICEYCKNNTPYGIRQVVRGKEKEHIQVTTGIEEFDKNVGFKFDKTNWMFFSTVVERFVDLGRPIQLQGKTINLKYKLIMSRPLTNDCVIEGATGFSHMVKIKKVIESYNILGFTPVLPSTTIPTTASVDKQYNHTCSICGKPAYFGLTVQCDTPGCPGG